MATVDNEYGFNNPDPDDGENLLGSCGCVDYHLADCPLNSRYDYEFYDPFDFDYDEDWDNDDSDIIDGEALFTVIGEPIWFDPQTGEFSTEPE